MTEIKDKCPACGSSMIRETKEETFTYKNEEFKQEILGLWCTKCPEAIFNGKDLQALEPAWKEFKEAVDNKTR